MFPVGYPIRVTAGLYYRCRQINDQYQRKQNNVNKYYRHRCTVDIG